MEGPLGHTPAAPALGRVRAVRGFYWAAMWGLYAREVSKSKKVWLVFSIGELLTYSLYFTVFAFALGPDRNTAEGQQVLLFLMPGLIALGFLMDAAQTTSFAIAYEKVETSIQDVLMAPLGPAEMTLAYAMSAASSALVNGSIITAAGFVLVPLATGQAMPTAMIWALPVFAVAGSMMMGVLGIVIGIWVTKWDHLSAAFSFALMPLIFLSGVFAPLEALPAWARPLMLANPVHHAIDGIRTSFLGVSQSGTLFSLAMVVGTTLALAALAFTMIRTGYRLRS